MAKRKKGNGIDAEQAGPYLSRIENLHKDLDSERGSYMAACKPVREDIKTTYEDAREQGIPTKALKALVKFRALERQQKKLGKGMDIDDGAAYEQLIEALGDFAGTPLGQATVDKAAVKARTAEELAEPIDELDKPFAERHADEKATDTAAFP